MKVVGITGGIGSGKTLATSFFNELGVPIYNADTRARQIQNQNKGVWLKTIKLLGRESYKEGQINPIYVASIVFNDDKKRKALEQIVHPVVWEDFLKWVDQSTESPYKIYESALLFETKAHEFCSKTIVVSAPLNLRIRRVMMRNKISELQVRQRMVKQMPEAVFLEKADYHLQNKGSKNDLQRQVQLLYFKIISDLKYG